MTYRSNEAPVVDVVNATNIPASITRPVPVNMHTVDMNLNVIEGFALKHRIPLEEALARFIALAPGYFGDDDKDIALLHSQAKLSLETMKAGSPKNVDHNVHGDVNLNITAIERRIVDLTD